MSARPTMWGFHGGFNRLLMLALVVLLFGCETCQGQSCFIQPAPQAGGGVQGPRGAAITNGVYVGSVDISTGGSLALEMTAINGTITGRTQPGNRVLILFTDQGSAFLYAPKGGQLPGGDSIASGAIAELVSAANGTVSMRVPFTGNGDYRINLVRDAARSSIDATPERIAGNYVGTDDQGVSYDIEIDANDGATFFAADSDGCVYRLETVFRESANVYSASGDRDPVCDAAGANFVRGATWNAQITSAAWIVQFRGETFALALSRR